jgi:hypothetical protein
MNALLGLLIVTAVAGEPRHQRHPEAVTLFECGFEEDWDKNFDAWPDRWTRRRSPGYPHYLSIKINRQPSAQGKRCLRIGLNGGAATVHSPPIEVGALYSYVMEAQLKTDSLKYDHAYCTVTFYDEKRKPLETFHSEQFINASRWKKLRVGPITPAHEDVRYAVIALHVGPIHPEANEDLKGAAMFDDVWFARLPRLTLTTNKKYNVYTGLDEAKVTVGLSGVGEANPRVTFELYDIWGKLVTRSKQTLKCKAVELNQKSADSFLLDDAAGEEKTYAGETKWTPPVKDFGYYRLQVKIEGDKGLIHEDRLSLAYVPPHAPVAGGEFGWTLPHGEQGLSLGELVQLLRMVGINWAKFPVWASSNDPHRVERLAWMAERLSFYNIELVGLLDNPPAEVREHLGVGTDAEAATIFSVESALWKPSLEPILTRLSLKMRWWQLGKDNDASFVGYPELDQKVEAVRKELAKFGQEVNLGIGWQWTHQLPDTKSPAWSYMTFSADPSLTAEEMGAYLSTKMRNNGKRWVTVEPLHRDHYSVEQRAADLVRRMMAAKMHKADCIFVPDPFSEKHGLMNSDGTPSELLLPWRITAVALANADYAGSIAMPGGSHNHIFTRGGKASMVIWSDRPTTETLYLGDKIEHIDIWGKRLSVGHDKHRQIIQVTTMPTFVFGINGPVARWRMSFKFARTKMPSISRRAHGNSYTMRNFFDQGASGQMTLVTPKVWKTYPTTSRINMATGEKQLVPFSITLPFAADSGTHDVRADFDISVDKRYLFSVYRHIDVGMGDVTINVRAVFNDKGDLKIVQNLTNHTRKHIRFKCYLLIPRRQRLQTLVQQYGRGTVNKEYRIAHPEDLIGEELLLQAEEIGSQRVLSYRIPIGQPKAKGGG